MTYIVRIAGQPVPFAPAPFEWRRRIGVAADIQAWELPAWLVTRLVAEHAGREVEIELDGRTIRRVIVIGNAPSADPQTQLLVITDVRWLWTRGWLVHDFNVRRRVGDRRLTGESDVPEEVRANVQDVQYAGWSLTPSGAPWRYSEMLERVARDAARAPGPGRSPVAFVVDRGSVLGEDRIVEETNADDSLPAGLARAISALPGRNLQVDDEGVVHVIDAIPGAERSMVERLGPPLLHHGALVWVDQSASRPARYRVWFTPEVEVRLAFGEPTVERDGPWVENVLEVPESSLDVPAVGGRRARTVAGGTYLVHEEAYAAWGAGPGQPPLSTDLVRTFFNGQTLENSYVRLPGGTQPDLEWLRRIRAVKASFRTLFRVNPAFWARVLSARAVRVALVDEETGTRAPSPVFADSAELYAYRSLHAGSTSLGSNATGSYAATVSGSRPARATLTIEDLEQGILRVEWALDKGGTITRVAPSALESEPNYDPTNDPGFNVGSWQTRALVRDHRLATVLSCVPAGPNDERRLYEVAISSQEAHQALELVGTTQPEQQETRGPDQVLRVTRTTARFGWSDADADKLLAFFRGPIDDPAAAPASVGLEPVNLREVTALARASAAADAALRFDHFQGVLAVPHVATARYDPVGSIGTVIYQVSSDASRVVLHAFAALAPLDPFAFLPASVRKILAREVQP